MAGFEPMPFSYHKYDPSRPMPAVVSDCPCPRCFNSNYTDRVEAAMQNMPLEGYHHVRDHMIVPVLKLFSEFNPALFPPTWIREKPPELVPSNPIRCLFHHMCLCLNVHMDVEGDEPEDVIRSIQGWGEELVSWLMRRRRSGGEAGQTERLRLARIVASLHELVGVDIIYRRIYIQVSKMMRRECSSVSPAVMCAYGFDLGREKHVVKIAQMFYDWYSVRRDPRSLTSLRILEYMRLVAVCFNNRRMRDIEQRTALAMALHHRLGAQAGIAVLGIDVLPVCVPKGMESIPTWRDVMGKWIGEEIKEHSS